MGKYGSHSAKSLPAAQSYDISGRIALATTANNAARPEKSVPPLWLCGHFAAKPYALMLERLDGGEHMGKTVLFWQVGFR